jgi:hypothetical protein
MARTMRFPLADLLRDSAGWYNYAEVVIWPTMGVVLLVASWRRAGAVRRDFRLAGLVLVVFGASDYFEAENGNEWWHPWWLFLWKAACVVALLAVLIGAWRRGRAADRIGAETAVEPSPPPVQ